MGREALAQTLKHVDPEAASFLLETRLVALDFLVFLVLVSVLASDSIVFAFAFLVGPVFILMKPVLEGSSVLSFAL